MIIKAAQFANFYHKGQVRKYSNKPYITHPIRVAGRVATHKNTTEVMVAAAFLHDVIEDCNASYDDILNNFGAEVADLVLELTNDKNIVGNRAKRKAHQRAKIQASSYEARLIKLIDRIDNLGEIPPSGDFAVVYAKESLLLLNEALVNTDEELENELRDIVNLIL
jgi:(p)ppGpp synthase/HD superfamily hydrolase